MRQDMAKVIVERPRWGSRSPSRKKGYRKFVQSVAIEDQTRRGPMLGRWRGRQRQFSDLIGPLRRFLHSQVGRPWNLVHRDLCEHISFDNVVQKHILQHVESEVERHVRMTERGPVHNAGWWTGRAIRPEALYVCPVSGLLKIAPRKRSAAPSRQYLRGTPLQYLFRDGSWWELRLRPAPPEATEAWDCWLERPVTAAIRQLRLDTYGGDFVATSKRLLSPTEARTTLRGLQLQKSDLAW